MQDLFAQGGGDAARLGFRVETQGGQREGERRDDIHDWASRSAVSRRLILPLSVLGNSARNSTNFGTMKSSRRRGAMTDDVALGERDPRRQGDDGFERRAQHRIGDADDHGLLHPLQLEQHALDFLGADLFAARLDDVVLAPDEIEKAVGIGSEEVAGVQNLFPGVGAGAQRSVGGVGVAPIALHHMGAANDEFADHVRPDLFAIVVDDIGFGAGNGDAHRRRPRLQLAGRQVCAALAFGEAVHGIKPRRRKQLLKALDMRRRQRGRRVGDVAQVEIAGLADRAFAGSARRWLARSENR